MPDKKEITRAGFGPRAAAFLADSLIAAIVLAFVRVPVFFASLFSGGALTARAFLFHYSFLDVLCWALTVLYFILLTYFTGSTLGKKLMRLRVEREDGEPLRLIDVIYRETVGRFLSGILCLGYFMVLADKDKRAFHDWLCATRVVYEGVTFRQREPKPAAAGSEAAAYSATSYSIPGGAAAAYSIPGGMASAYSIPGGEPGTRVIPDAAPDLSLPFPAEEPHE